MPRRGENIYKRKDGRWEARILRPDGKYKYVYAKTYKEVKEKKNNFKEGQTQERTPDTIKCASQLFEQWLNKSFHSCIKRSTYENYYSCMYKYVIPFFRYSDNDQLTEFQVGQFVKSIYENTSLTNSYKKKILSIFKTALREIIKTSGNNASITEIIKLPKAENSAVQVFSIKEQRLVENAAMHSKDKRLLGVLLCFYTGIRLGELCALTWEDIDFEAGTMSINKTVGRTKNFQPSEAKTSLLISMPKSQNSIRKIPLPGFILKMSGESRIHKQGENCYILSGSDTPLDPRTYQKLFKKLLVSAGVKNRKFHAIRHTFATRALELGVDIKTLSEILGHSNVSITLNIYTHSLLEQKKIAINKLNDMHLAHMEIASLAVTTSVICN